MARRIAPNSSASVAIATATSRRSSAVAWHIDDGRLFTLGYDIDELEDVQNLVLRALGLGLAPALLLSLTAGVMLALRAQRRIASVHEAVGRIVQGRLAERLPVRGSGDDLDRLASTVNGMLDAIERLVVEVQGVGDNIAHDAGLKKAER